MLRNYLLVAWRNLRKNGMSVTINVVGLAIGICVCLLISAYVLHEWSYDDFHRDAGRIYSVNISMRTGQDSLQLPLMSAVTGPMVLHSDPSVEDYLRMRLEHKEVKFENSAKTDAGDGGAHRERELLFADSNFFTFFSFRLLSGDPRHALDAPFSIVLTPRAAERYFGKANPLGKTLRYENNYLFKVTGIAAAPPSNSSIRFDFVLSLSTMAQLPDESVFLKSTIVQAGGLKTFLRFRTETSPDEVAAALGKLAAAGENGQRNERFYLSPLVGSHLREKRADAYSGRYLKIFPFAAGLVLILALINYLSLTTAAATLRAKEVGVRKVMGASTGKISMQFFIESSLYAVVSFLLGILGFAVLAPEFFNLLQIKADPGFLLRPEVGGILVMLLIFIIITAGSYPAFVLSTFDPATTLHGKMRKQTGGRLVRKFFTSFQFFVSLVLVIFCFCVQQQLYFFQHTSTGIDRDKVVMIPFSAKIGSHLPALGREMANVKGVGGVACAHYPMYKGNDNFFVQPKGREESIPLTVMNVDQSFIPLVGLKWAVAPRDPNVLTHQHAVVLNETAVAAMNFTGDPIGNYIRLGNTDYAVAGVLKDFNYETLHDKIGPLCLSVHVDSSSDWVAMSSGCLFVKLDGRSASTAVLSNLKRVNAQFDADSPLAFEFMDDAFDALYKAEDRLATLFDYFSALTIGVSLLGLFGLTVFNTTQRIKEISIRKTIGARTLDILRLFLSDLVPLVVLAVIVAFPVAWYFSDRWLDSFAYRIRVDPWVFLLAGGGLFLLSAATVTGVVLNAAAKTQANNLRLE